MMPEVTFSSYKQLIIIKTRQVKFEADLKCFYTDICNMKYEALSRDIKGYF